MTHVPWTEGQGSSAATHLVLIYLHDSAPSLQELTTKWEEAQHAAEYWTLTLDILRLKKAK